MWWRYTTVWQVNMTHIWKVAQFLISKFYYELAYVLFCMGTRHLNLILSLQIRLCRITTKFDVLCGASRTSAWFLQVFGNIASGMHPRASVEWMVAAFRRSHWLDHGHSLGWRATFTASESHSCGNYVCSANWYTDVSASALSRVITLNQIFW